MADQLLLPNNINLYFDKGSYFSDTQALGVHLHDTV